jgi:sugar lactone lactonase YvrE
MHEATIFCKQEEFCNQKNLERIKNKEPFMTSGKCILLRAAALLAAVLILLAAKPAQAACTGAGQSSQTLYLAANNNIFVYTLGAASPRLIITGGLANPTQIATDAAGKRYVSNFGTYPDYADGSVTEYERGHTSPTLTRTVGAFSASGVAVDALGNVYVSSYYRNTVSVYHPGQVTPFLVFDKGIISPGRLAVRGTSLYVTELGYPNILRFPSGSPAATPLTLTVKPPDTLPPGQQIFARDFVVGPDGTVYAAGTSVGPEIGVGDFVNVFAPGETSPRASAVVFADPSAASAPGIAFGNDDLYAATVDNFNAVYQYEVGGDLTLVRTITTGINQPFFSLLALDAGGCLYAGNDNGLVTVYPPGATKPSQTITVPGGGPLDLIFIGR